MAKRPTQTKPADVVADDQTVEAKDAAVTPKEEIKEDVVVEEPVVETVEDEPTTDVVEDAKPETDEEERIRLAKELNMTVRKDANTGKAILPSTPAMRAAAAAAARTVVMPVPGIDIEKHVIDTYGEDVAQEPNIKLIISTLSTYVKRMSPSASIDEKSGGEVQASLASMYDVVLSLKPEYAQVGLEIIVAVIKRHVSGAFSETAALRFANTMPVNSERALRFQLLTTLFMALANGTNKKDLGKVINIRQLVEYISSRDAKANISEFIN